MYSIYEREYEVLSRPVSKDNADIKKD